MYMQVEKPVMVPAGAGVHGVLLSSPSLRSRHDLSTAEFSKGVPVARNERAAACVGGRRALPLQGEEVEDAIHLRYGNRALSNCRIKCDSHYVWRPSCEISYQTSMHLTHAALAAFRTIVLAAAPFVLARDAPHDFASNSNSEPFHALDFDFAQPFPEEGCRSRKLSVQADTDGVLDAVMMTWDLALHGDVTYSTRCVGPRMREE